MRRSAKGVMRLLILPALLICLATACIGRGGDARPTYSVSYPMQKVLLERIAGDRFNINTLIPPGTNPESYDPSVSTLVSLEKSKAFFRLNTPGFEQSVMARTGRNYAGLDLVDADKGIVRIEGTHGHGEEDPHIWNSVRNARVMAANMASYLASTDKGNASAYRKNASRLDDDLRALDDSIASILSGAKGASFVVMHPSLSYFARDYGLHQIAMETEGKEATPRQLAERMNAARRSGAKVMVHDREHSSAQAETIARQLGLRLVLVSLNGYDWEDNLVKLAREIAAGAAESNTEPDNG
ncbi:MAG: zinc ABC transporter substrate-binding protein [Muribaculaceae bacterium]|nr:zinc ABC transporter substrate-binding protein [Muribaculaceae bacterium]